MTRKSHRGLTLAASFVAVVLCVAQAGATTPCDTDPNRVPFQATVDPTVLNFLLSLLGNPELRTPDVNLTLSGLCVDHQIGIATGVSHLPFGQAPFTVTPALGSLRVDLDLPGPYEVGIDGRDYSAVNCSSICRVEVPYLGEVFNGCNIESAIVRPVLSLLHATVAWDDIKVSQVADTCVLGDCTAVHPLERSSVSLTNFDIDLTGFGSCSIFLDFPDPLPDLGPFDPCQGIDPLIEALLRPVLEDTVNKFLVTSDGKGLLIEVFANDIGTDFGCIPIPEVANCKKASPVAGAVRRPQDFGVNALFYSLPLGVAGVLSLRLRRRSRPKAPPA
jgi:hypothetical protein